MTIPLILLLSLVTDKDIKSLYDKMGVTAVEEREAPDFRLPGLSGDTLSLADFRGKIVFLNFWASWCPPCRKEMPSMEKLWREYKDDGLVIVAVNLGEPRKKKYLNSLRNWI